MKFPNSLVYHGISQSTRGFGGRLIAGRLSSSQKFRANCKNDQVHVASSDQNWGSWDTTNIQALLVLVVKPLVDYSTTTRCQVGCWNSCHVASTTATLLLFDMGVELREPGARFSTDLGIAGNRSEPTISPIPTYSHLFPPIPMVFNMGRKVEDPNQGTFCIDFDS